MLALDNSKQGGNQSITHLNVKILGREERSPYWRCVDCLHPITRPSEAIMIDGRHRHHFLNPAGIIYEIGCFRAAEGCRTQGIMTLEHTWFAGFYWCFASCRRCHRHLGWFYQSDTQFYGLILKGLIFDQFDP